jgi:hypothetical protein
MKMGAFVVCRVGTAHRISLVGGAHPIKETNRGDLNSAWLYLEKPVVSNFVRPEDLENLLSAANTRRSVF